MKVSKVVLMVVALHVLVIGGIFIFEGCTRTKTPAASVAENESSDMSATNSPALPAPTPPGVAELTPTTPGPTPAVTTPVAPVAPVTPAVAARAYVVKKGDTLTKICKAEKVSVTELSKANHLTKTSVLKVGQKLQIPGKAEATAIAAAQPTAPVGALTATAPVTTDGASYVVKSGDSLWKIAKAQNSTIAAIKQANHLSSDSLKVGQKLQIPAKTVTAVASATTTPELGGSVVENGQTKHVVDIGESPAGIAKKYGVKVDDLMKANNITDARRIMVGQTLTIPSAQPAVLASPAPAATPAAAAPAVKPITTAPAAMTAVPLTTS